MTITIERVTAEGAARLEGFHRALGGEAGVAGLRASRAGHDWLRDDNVWLLLAAVDGEAAGTAVAARIPKADARAGFLYVDELVVLPEFRRRGVASALLAHVDALAAELGLAGVRLLVRVENAAARGLYRKAGFRESATLLCQKKS